MRKPSISPNYGNQGADSILEKISANIKISIVKKSKNINYFAKKKSLFFQVESKSS